jgi:pilus assembly protein CpaF
MTPPPDSSTVIAELDADVRAQVRRHGVDPQLDVPAVRQMAIAAVRAHDQASLSGVVRPLDEPDSVIDELVARVAGLGALQRYLDDPAVEEFRSYPRTSQGAVATAERTLMPRSGR